MLALPLAICPADEPEKLLDGLQALIRSAYGEQASEACYEASASLKRAKEKIIAASCESEAEASRAERDLLTYLAVLRRLHDPLAAEVRDQQNLAFSWQSAWNTADKVRKLFLAACP